MSGRPEDRPRDAGSSADQETLLTMVWAALGGGVLLFAVVTLLVLGPFEEARDPRPWRWGWLALAVLTVAAIGWLRGRLTASTTDEKRRATAILAWALAEGQAMIGLVAYLLTGDLIPAVVGLALGAYLFLRHRPRTFLSR